MSIIRPLAASLFGAALLGVPASYYQITRLECTAQLSVAEHLFACGSYLLGVALLSMGWVGMLRRTDPTQQLEAPPKLMTVLGLGAMVQLLALGGLPFLSLDPLFYASMGRAAARFAGSPYVRLCDSLPSSDPFLRLLPGVWRCGTSAYGSGFNTVATLLARLGGDSLSRQLRLYQLLGLTTMVLTAGLAGLAARAAAVRKKQPDRGAWAATLVLFSPLCVIEGTLNAHNDAFLALAVAGFAFFATRRRPLLAAMALLSGLLIKLSALLLVGFYLARQALVMARRYLHFTSARGARIAVLSILSVTAALAGLALLRAFWPTLATPAHAVLELFGNPSTSARHCTRSVECLPRSILVFFLNAPTGAWLVGLGFRVLGGLLLLYAAWRSAADEGPLTWAGSFFLLYYLYLHGWMQSWYFLPMLPLLAFVPPRLRRVALMTCVTAVAYYVLYIPVYCLFSTETPVLVGASEFGQAATVILPPTAALLWGHVDKPTAQVG